MVRTSIFLRMDTGNVCTIKVTLVHELQSATSFNPTEMAESVDVQVLQERSVTIDPVTGARTVHPRLERRLTDIGGGQKIWMTVNVFDEPEDQRFAKVLFSKDPPTQ